MEYGLLVRLVCEHVTGYIENSCMSTNKLEKITLSLFLNTFFFSSIMYQDNDQNKAIDASKVRICGTTTVSSSLPAEVNSES